MTLIRDSRNSLRVEIYSSGTTPVLDMDGSIAGAIIESFSTFYPGGIYGPARIFIPRLVTRAWLVREMQRVVILNGSIIVWEGIIGEITRRVDEHDQGMVLECVGQWGALLGRTWNKVWADIRISEEIWVRQPENDDYDQLVNIDRLNRISVGPQVRTWGNGDIVAAFAYTMPTGETIKRIVANSKNRTSGQSWETRMRDTVGASNVFNNTSDGTPSAHDVTLGTPRQALQFQFVSNASQSPGGPVYGRISGVTVYSETGGITPTSVMQNIRAHLSGINADESQIAVNSFILEPFFTDGPETINSILARAASFGDDSFNPWAAYFLASDRAATPDGKPVLCFQPYPTLTDTDYALRLDESNVSGAFEIKRAVIGSVFNFIIVKYRDEVNNKNLIITPDDDATLKDQSSIDLYGEQHLVLDAGTASQTTALNYAKRVLAANKDAKYRVTAPIVVSGTIRTQPGFEIPVCRVRAGQRVKIENFISDEVGIAGAGLTFLITGTEYDPEAETVSISTGVPDQLAVYLARRALLDDRQVR